MGYLWLVLYIATIFSANWAIVTFGMVPVTPSWLFGLMAPAGVYFAGLAFTFRDLIHETLGRWWVIGAILAGAALSAFVSPQFALASGIAFLVSEAFDFFVYVPLRKRHWLGAVFASNIVGLIADSALFLFLAFGSLAFLQGQIVGKLWVTLIFVAILFFVRQRFEKKIADESTAEPMIDTDFGRR